MAALATPDIVVSAGLRVIRETLSAEKSSAAYPSGSWLDWERSSSAWTGTETTLGIPTPSRFVALGLTPQPPTRTLLGWMPIASAATRPAYGPDADAA